MPTINRTQLMERVNQPDYLANFAPYLPAITASKAELLAAFNSLDDADRYQALWQSLIQGTPFNAVFMVARLGTPTDYSRGHYAKIIAALTLLIETYPTFELNQQNLAAMQTDAKLLRYLQHEHLNLFIALTIPPSMEQSDAALEGLLQATDMCLERLIQSPTAANLLKYATYLSYLEQTVKVDPAIASSAQFSSTHHAPQNKPLHFNESNLNKAYYDLAYGYYKKIRINPSLPLEASGASALRQALTFIQYAIQLNVTTGSANNAVENARNTDEHARFGRNDPKNWQLMARIVTDLIAANGPHDPYHNQYQLTLLCCRRNALTYSRTVYDRDPNVKDASFDTEAIIDAMRKRYQENWRDLKTFNALPREATTYLLSHMIRYPYHNIFNVNEPGETERPPRRVDLQTAIREVMPQCQAFKMEPWLMPTYRASQFLHEAPRKDRLLNAMLKFDDPQLRHQALWQSLIKGTVLNAIFSVQTQLQPVTYANDYYQPILRELNNLSANTSLRLDALTQQALTADNELLTYLQVKQPTLFASLPPEVTAHMPALTQPPTRFMNAFMNAIHSGKASHHEKTPPAPILLLKPIGKRYDDV